MSTISDLFNHFENTSINISKVFTAASIFLSLSEGDKEQVFKYLMNSTPEDINEISFLKERSGTEFYALTTEIKNPEYLELNQIRAYIFSQPCKELRTSRGTKFSYLPNTLFYKEDDDAFFIHISFSDSNFDSSMIIQLDQSIKKKKRNEIIQALEKDLIFRCDEIQSIYASYIPETSLVLVKTESLTSNLKRLKDFFSFVRDGEENPVSSTYSKYNVNLLQNVFNTHYNTSDVVLQEHIDILKTFPPDVVFTTDEYLYLDSKSNNSEAWYYHQKFPLALSLVDKAKLSMKAKTPQRKIYDLIKQLKK